MHKSDIDYLNNTVFATLRPSPIEGVGVFAIRDIPKGTEITEYTAHNIGTQKVYSLTRDELKELRPEILTLILDRMVYPKGIKLFSFHSPNSNYTLTSFCNYSEKPNFDSKVTLRDIKEGEELLIDFTKYYELDEITLNHMKFIV